MDVYIQHLVGSNSDTQPDSDVLLQSTLSIATVSELSQELGRRLDNSKEAILHTLRDNPNVYERAVAETDKAQMAISGLLRGVDDMQALLGDERSGIHARLVDATENEARLRGQLQENGAVLTCLRLLSRLNAILRSMDALIRDSRLDQAAEMLVALERELGGATSIGNTRISSVLAARVDQAKENIKQNAVAALHKLLVIRVEDGLAQLSISIDPLDQLGSRVQSLFAALDTLGVQDEVLAAYGAHFVKSFIRPVLASPVITQETYSTDESDQRFGVRCDDSTTHASGAVDVCAIVTNAFAFVNQTLLPNYPASGSTEHSTRLVSLWTHQCLSDVTNMVLERCFLRCIPTTRHELEEFRGTTDVLLEFESRLFELCPAPISDTVSRPIHTAVARLEELFVEHRCDLAQSRARELAEDSSFALFEFEHHEVWSLDLVRGMVTNSDCVISPPLVEAAEKVVTQHTAGASGGTSVALVYPKCSISRSMHQLVLEVYRLVNEAALSSDLPAVSRLLLNTAQQIFDLYRALYLTLHRAQLTKIPALAWQFFNDCLYASHHAGIVAQLLSVLNIGSSESSGSCEVWLDTARRFIGVGNSHIADLVSREARELKALISGSSDAFYDAASESSKVQLAKSRKQVHLAVSQLARAMRPPVVTPRIYYQTLGRYFDAVCTATIDMVSGIRDIGVDDSKVLSDHCRSICALSELFHLDPHMLEPYRHLLATTTAFGEHGLSVEDDDLLDSDSETMPLQPTGGKDVKGSALSARLAKEHCKLSSKLVQLADILLISRADILARRRAGLLAQFTTEELTDLIRALFSDTKERAQDIDTLKSID
ncbi:ribosome biogenesis protein ytm1 [Coemansia sp. RSA 922]|nr:ribosome biogenesis protein ytm1 [Coemansia sp. S3946]KAJ2047988.1 ribosome biogenesis protein ytm1 [Coemansia sp. S16]KAJ2117299.1 ribosome biogenesis protein ytm1 [Coemansia sp. RSA 922]